ncbi:MAG TPA: hypothetical protein PLI19_03045 [Erysipelotrichaceae bacterium]|nr:hypothetical protein [Erysipelotrichaceae bacterium]HQB32288.1 hypothetical protein [Erysipelotrichaceae bacterium]
MKRRVFIASIVVILLSIGVMSTYAYIVAEGTATNVITTGCVNIELREYTLNENNERVPYSNSQVAVVPSVKVDKIVNVENTGNQPVFVRVLVTITVESEFWEDFDLSNIILDYNLTDWTFKDGYWYYNNILDASNTTEDLFTSVEFSANMGNEFMGSAITINVEAQATQVANQGVSNATEAVGWPD